MKILKHLFLLLIILVSSTTTAQDFNDEQLSGYYIGEYYRIVLFHLEFKNDSMIVTEGRKLADWKVSFPKVGPHEYLSGKDTMVIRVNNNKTIIEAKHDPDNNPNIRRTIKIDYQPKKIKILKDVMVTMSDGVKIATDIYMPEDAPGPLPVILTRTPYQKDVTNYRMDAHLFVEQGFVFIIQDVRGKYKSEGDYMVQGDRQDYYECIDWASKQEWSNGNVGTYGCSYAGENQLLVGTLKHPAHKAMIPASAAGAIGKLQDSRRYFGYFEGGANALSSMVNWFAEDGTTDRDYKQVVNQDNINSILNYLPIIDIPKTFGIPKTNYEDFLTHDLNDPWWDQFGYLNEQHSFNTPALHIEEWFDLMPLETAQIAEYMSQNSTSKLAGDNQFLILAPGQHCSFLRMNSNRQMAGDLVSNNVYFDIFQLTVDWFNHWLRDESKENFNFPKVKYFTTGADVWKSSAVWPPKTSKRTPFYLSSNGRANTKNGNGRLTMRKGSPKKADTYLYDPTNPVPSGSLKPSDDSCCDVGSYDQSNVEDREDVLVYTSEILENNLELTGNIEAQLYVSSSAKDTDFTVKLVEVYPDGRSMNLTETILRARYRDGFSKEVFMKPNEIYPLNIKMQAISHLIKKGHRIRIEITSSNFPRYDRNLNTGGKNYDESRGVIATNTIWHDDAHPSAIYLPIVKN